MKRIISSAAILAVLVLSACDASVPSALNMDKIQVTEDMATQTLDGKRVDEAAVNVIAEQYMHNGRSGMTLTTAYPEDEPTLAIRARNRGEDYKSAFERQGVSGIDIVVIPIADRAHADKVIVTYKTMIARAPEDCGDLAGSRGATDMEVVDSYSFGCSTKKIMSKMVADPTDLLGKGGAQENDSRRAGATVEKYNSGKPNDPLKGFKASSLGSGG